MGYLKIWKESVDDLLGQCKSLQKMWDTLAEVLVPIIERNMVFSIDKFKLSQSIIYGGFTLKASAGEPIKIRPDQSRLDTLLETFPPKTKSELSSFLGFINTFKIWSPSLNPHSSILRDLARKDTIFLWTIEAQLEFD